MRTMGLAAVSLFLIASSAFATTKGLIQIITPDVQPEGQLSISYQQQDPTIGNSSEVQLELGITKYAEIALFRGLNPSQNILGFEAGLQRGAWLGAAGFANWTSGGGPHSNPQPFIEAGHYEGRHKAIAGAIRVSNHTQAILGYAYQLSPKLALQTDFQSGAGNAATVGFTYNITDNLSVNPAVYLSNSAPRTAHGYAVLSWTLKAF
jgi:hypothetical protein